MPADVIDLTETVRPPAGATMHVQAWPEMHRAELTLQLSVVEGTLQDFEARLRENGWAEGYRVRQLCGAKLVPGTRYRAVRALQPANRNSQGGSRASRASYSSGSAVVPQQTPRQRTQTYHVTCPVSFDLLAKVIVPEFTTAQGIKEIVDNSVQSLVFLFQIDNLKLSNWQENAQIVIILDLQRRMMRIVDNGGGCVAPSLALDPPHAPTSARCSLTHGLAHAGSTRSR